MELSKPDSAPGEQGINLSAPSEINLSTLDTDCLQDMEDAELTKSAETLLHEVRTQHFSRTCAGAFFNGAIETEYLTANPGRSVPVSSRALLAMTWVMFIFRASFLSVDYFNELDGRDSDKYTTSLILGGALAVLVSLLCISIHLFTSSLAVKVTTSRPPYRTLPPQLTLRSTGAYSRADAADNHDIYFVGLCVAIHRCAVLH